MSLRKRIFARALAFVSPTHERHLAARKAKLLETAHGHVVELGPGTGVNFTYFPTDIRWTGIEPNIHLHPVIRDAAAARRTPEINLLELPGERLPLEDASADAVVATLVLCSVKDPQAVLYEVKRILKPGGRYYFVEHVAAECGTRTRTRQNFIQPAWTFIADGCHPNRESLALIRAAGFSRVEAEEFHTPLGIFAPHIAGFAER